MADELRARILDDLKTAMKAGDKERLAVLRMIKAEIQRREVELRAERGRDYELPDDEVLAVLTRAAKQRRESIESFRGGGRDDLAAREEAELAVVEAYLPRALTDDELSALVEAAIAETGAAAPADMGKVMKVLVPRTKGRADGKRVSALVRERLAG
jgi:uncharacterized protein YqeY